MITLFKKLYSRRFARSLLLIIMAIALVIGLGANNVLADNALYSIIGGTPFYDSDTNPSTGTCTSTSNPSSSPTGNSALTSGSDIYILGDSITELSESTYVSDFQQKGITAYVDPSSSRSLNVAGTDGNQLSGMQAIAADQSQIQKAQAIVIALGTNDGDTDSSVDQALPPLILKCQFTESIPSLSAEQPRLEKLLGTSKWSDPITKLFIANLRRKIILLYLGIIPLIQMATHKVRMALKQILMVILITTMD